MCIDPISATALIGTAIASATSSVGAAVGGLTLAQGITAGAGFLGAAGTLIQSEGEANAADASARNALAAGYSQESDQRAKDRADMASQIADLSDRGQAVSTGTPLALIRESARNSEINALRIRANAQNQSAAYRTQAAGQRIAGPISAAGQILSIGSKLQQLGAIG